MLRSVPLQAAAAKHGDQAIAHQGSRARPRLDSRWTQEGNTLDLATTDGLAQTCQQIVAARQSDPLYQSWTQRIERHLARVQQASHAQFLAVEFQRELWENEDISATGIGRVPTAALWQDPFVVDQLWNVRQLPPDADSNTLNTQLTGHWNALVEHIHTLKQRIPRLKLARAFAALQPSRFTTLASHSALAQLARAMQVGGPGDSMVLLNAHVLTQIDAALADTPLAARKDWPLVRMKLPWMLYEAMGHAPAKGVTTQAGNDPGTLRLQPLPANRRRKGLLAIGGGLDTVLAMLEFARNGCSRTDFREHLRSLNPSLATASIDTQTNALIGEWGAIEASDDHLALTDRGRALLDTGEAEEASDWLLTQILGFDNALYALRNGALLQKELVSAVQAVNPGWTSNFAPTVIVNWLRNLGLVTDPDKDKRLALTERGREWLERIDWTPGELAPHQLDAPAPPPDAPANGHVATLTRPSVAALGASFPPDLIFPDTLVAQLDAALWSHPRRHFAVLTGLSGAGKTELAVHYAKALWLDEPADRRNEGVCIVPVQPGWNDPSALLGYVNPLATDTYIRTGFLNFLLNAARDPDRAYTVVLDEMNLSHPEQYLAPLLSAMETGDSIELHANGGDVEEIPASVAYPPNLVIIGTVNMDETTHGLSDKVLDRATVIEFWDIDVDAWPGWATAKLPSAQRDALQKILGELGAALAPVRLHFGWRTIGDIAGYVAAANQGGQLQFDVAVDQAIHAKVLPKLRGEDNPALRTALNATRAVLHTHALGQSAAKVDQLCAELDRSGIARFWR